MRLRRSPGRNPYPGVSKNTDRHGKVRWRLRKKGLPPTYLPGEYGSAEFRAAYEAALKGVSPAPGESLHHTRGTFDWLMEQYQRTPKWQKMAPISRRNLRYDFDRFSREHGKKSVVGLRPEHVEAIVARKAATPSSANKLLKLVKRLCRYAIRRGIISADPTVSVERYAENPDGFHTWTDGEILQFEAHHGHGSKAVLAMRLMLYTGAARQDVCMMGWQNVREGRISYRRGKTGGEVDLPILDELAEVLERLPRNRLLFITHSRDLPYKPETFGNWFHECCVAAGMGHCSPHGLRKAGATRLANAGATEFEIMAFLGHKTPAEASTYTKKANRKTLADSGMAKLVSPKREQKLSNR